MYKLEIRANCIAIVCQGQIHMTFDHNEMRDAMVVLRGLN